MLSRPSAGLAIALRNPSAESACRHKYGDESAVMAEPVPEYGFAYPAHDPDCGGVDYDIANRRRGGA
jgi:hypothetical protein